MVSPGKGTEKPGNLQWTEAKAVTRALKSWLTFKVAEMRAVGQAAQHTTQENPQHTEQEQPAGLQESRTG